MIVTILGNTIRPSVLGVPYGETKIQKWHKDARSLCTTSESQQYSRRISVVKGFGILPTCRIDFTTLRLIAKS